MTWVRKQTAEPRHECALPMREANYDVPSMMGDEPPTKWTENVPDGREGDLWRCPDCRKLWLIAMGCERCKWDGYHGTHYAGLMLRHMWMPARWWQRVIYSRK